MVANLHRAIELDPGYAEALSLMASVHAPNRWVQTCDTADLDHAIDYATRAIAVDPNLGSAHVARGYAYWRKGDFQGAIDEQNAAVRLEPSSMGYYFLGACYSELGRYEEALEASQRFHRIIPAPFNLMILGFQHMQLGHFAEARWALGEGARAELSPEGFKWQGAMSVLAELNRREGRLVEARATCMEALRWVERSDFM
jgi:tetratricopeptide (TPR) repeat protein